MAGIFDRAAIIGSTQLQFCCEIALIPPQNSTFIRTKTAFSTLFMAFVSSNSELNRSKTPIRTDPHRPTVSIVSWD
jgi:hypothetical protein